MFRFAVDRGEARVRLGRIALLASVVWRDPIGSFELRYIRILDEGFLLSSACRVGLYIALFQVDQLEALVL